MPDHVRYIQKDGQSLDVAIVRRRFFEAVLCNGVGPDKACAIWNDAVFGDRYARQIIEKLCDIEIVANEAGFGFLES
jgi:hypothetical protein